VILVLDHDEALLAVLSDLLLLEGHAVRRATSTTEALAVLAAEPVDLIITDTMRSVWEPRLPTLHQLHAAAPRTPIALFTAWTEAGALDLGNAGLAAVWQKPLDLDLMLAEVQSLLATAPPDC
jgi:CheY-like chemotaxis protein